MADGKKGSEARPSRKKGLNGVNGGGGKPQDSSRDDPGLSELSGTFIKSMLSDTTQATSAGDGNKEKQHHHSDVTLSVRAVRRLVVGLLVAVLVVALVSGIWFGLHSGNSVSSDSTSGKTAQTGQPGHSGHSGQTGKANNKDVTKTAQKRSSAGQLQAQARAKALTPTKLPSLTDKGRADILSKAQATAAASGKQTRQYSYCVSSRGTVKETDLSVFENTVFRTLNDPRGWPRAGATFVYGEDSDKCDFVMYLAQASTVPSFSAGCSEKYSCRAGNNVIVNEDRWDEATQQLLDAGINIDAYRQMVINHEVGHRLGHLDNEPSCTVSGSPAPLMQEQSMDLRGCKPNSWPLDEELWID